MNIVRSFQLIPHIYTCWYV